MRKGEVRKTQILAVAERLFLGRGYLSTTLADILSDIGCTKGSFYHHFDSKFAVLDEIARLRAARAVGVFREQPATTGVERLNLLLYHALPLGNAEQDFLAVVLGLGDTSEGTLLVRRLLVSRRQSFLPLLTEQLTDMRLKGLAGFGNLAVIQLVWDATMAFCTDTILQMAQGKEPTAERLMPKLNALRFLWERVLDLPYGSIQIIALSELTSVLSYAFTKAAVSSEADALPTTGE